MFQCRMTSYYSIDYQVNKWNFPVDIKPISPIHYYVVIKEKYFIIGI